eukprot:gnl/TRDRNA2_/TRDRNA2_38515_c0_seq1.p1 gnl/TRDRNA2_/TRDRNA2_38515_c0~~gnl/TRDRNA2_/TRDRNA2_38515_c0_seq1.p1  ORF type:complete len:319 (+),score=71.77 gnl/TRDRNA2_/TRDRNA2_38515_c0_seq1:96-959(+)
MPADAEQLMQKQHQAGLAPPPLWKTGKPPTLDRKLSEVSEVSEARAAAAASKWKDPPFLPFDSAWASNWLGDDPRAVGSDMLDIDSIEKAKIPDRIKDVLVKQLEGQLKCKNGVMCDQMKEMLRKKKQLIDKQISEYNKIQAEAAAFRPLSKEHSAAQDRLRKLRIDVQSILEEAKQEMSEAHAQHQHKAEKADPTVKHQDVSVELRRAGTSSMVDEHAEQTAALREEQEGIMEETLKEVQKPNDRLPHHQGPRPEPTVRDGDVSVELQHRQRGKEVVQMLTVSDQK